MTDEIREEGVKALVASGQSIPGAARKTLQQGCSTTLRAALDPELETVISDGKESCYLVDCQIVIDSRVAEYAIDQNNARKLWEISEEMVGETFTW